jgi:PAS domain S-box-containing protein
LLAATFEHVDAGISVVDAEMNLVAWNSQYLEIFGSPPGLVHVGTPIADLIRYNARLGDFGSEDIEHHVHKRLNHRRRGQPNSFERQRKDGRVIKTVGRPMPGGGYVTSFADISDEAEVREELERTLAQLEQRVAERTAALSTANRQLAEATRDKTRFLAAASHDLLQPLHAARLFTAALSRDAEPNTQMLAGRVDSAISAADGLIRALLDISRLDAGGVDPTPEPVALGPSLTDLAHSFLPMADAKGGPCVLVRCLAMFTPVRGCCALSCKTSFPRRCVIRRAAA